MDDEESLDFFLKMGSIKNFGNCLAPAPSFSSVSVHQDLPIHEGESKRRQNVAGPPTLVDARAVTRRKAQGANRRSCFADQGACAFLEKGENLIAKSLYHND